MISDCQNILIILERSSSFFFMEKLDMRSKFSLSVQEAAVEILGRQEVQQKFGSVLGTEHSSPILSSDPAMNLLAEISSEFSIKYHLNTARGLMLRIGEAAFSKLQMRFDDLHALGSMENRLLPLEKKFSNALTVLVDIISSVIGASFTVEARGDYCYCVVDSRQGAAAMNGDLDLYFIAGLLRAFGMWLDSRRQYLVQVGSDHGPRDCAGSVCLHIQPPQ